MACLLTCGVSRNEARGWIRENIMKEGQKACDMSQEHLTGHRVEERLRHGRRQGEKVGKMGNHGISAMLSMLCATFQPSVASG